MKSRCYSRESQEETRALYYGYCREGQKKRGQDIPKKTGDWVDNKFIYKMLHEVIHLETRKQMGVHEERAFTKKRVNHQLPAVFSPVCAWMVTPSHVVTHDEAISACYVSPKP